MQAETQGMVKNWAERLDDLGRRADAANASRMFATAKSKLDEMRGMIGTATNDIPKIKDKLELQKAFDKYSEHLQEGYTEINGDFDAIEAWITLAEAKPAQVSKSEPAVPPPPVDPNGNPVR